MSEDKTIDDFGQRLAAERELLNARDFTLPVMMGLAPAISICGLLQLAMRHPGTKGQPSEAMARTFVAGIIHSLEAAGFKEHAQLIRMGDNPVHDQPVV